MWPYLVFLIAFGATMLFGVWSKWRARRVFQEHVTGGLKEPMTGALAAGALCRAGGARVVVESGGRYLSRHFDAKSRTLSLDPFTYEGRSITSIGKGLFEAGHVLQQRQCYRWFRLRPGTVPLNNFGVRKFGSFCFYGVILHSMSFEVNPPHRHGVERAVDTFSEGAATLLRFLGNGSFVFAALLFLMVVASQLCAFWVGIDASKRAIASLGKADFRATRAEREDLAKVIEAAPWAYVGVALTALVGMRNRQAIEAPVHVNARDVAYCFYY